MMTWLIALADTTHIVVGSVEIFYLVFNGSLPWQDFIWPFAADAGWQHLRRDVYFRAVKPCPDS
jgi:hypothetical protein